MDDDAAPASPSAAMVASEAIEHGRLLPRRKAILLQLEQLAIQELASAQPLLNAAEHVIDPLLACIGWDLDSPRS